MVRVDFAPYETSSRADRGNASGPAAHEWVEHIITGHGLNEAGQEINRLLGRMNAGRRGDIRAGQNASHPAVKHFSRHPVGCEHDVLVLVSPIGAHAEMSFRPDQALIDPVNRRLPASRTRSESAANL